MSTFIGRLERLVIDPGRSSETVLYSVQINKECVPVRLCLSCGNCNRKIHFRANDQDKIDEMIDRHNKDCDYRNFELRIA